MRLQVQWIFALILLVLAGMSFYISSFLSGFLLLICAVILFFSNKKYWKSFLKSFHWGNIAKTGVLEAINLLVLAGIVMGAGLLLNLRASSLATNFRAMTQSAVQMNMAAAQSFILTSVAVVLAAILFAFLSYTITRFFIWRILVKKQKFGKFLLMNLVWWLLWLPVAILIFVAVRPAAVPVVAGILFVLYLYRTFFVHYAFNKSGRIFFSLEHPSMAERFGAVKMPLIYCVSLFLLVSVLLRFISTTWLAFIATVFFICWIRIYFLDSIKKR